MEEGRTTELDVSEFDYLLKEIPRVTSGNSHPRYPITIEENSTTPSLPRNFTNLYNSPQFGGLTFEDPNNFHGRRLLNCGQDKSLSAAFEELSFKDNVVPKPTNSSFFICNQTSPNHGSLNDSQNLFVMDNLEMPFLPLHQSMNGFNIDGNASFSGRGGFELTTQNPDILSSELIPMYKRDLPLNPRVHANQLHPNVRAPTSLTPLHFGQSNMSLHYLEEETYYRLQQQQYLYQRHLHNQRSEAIQYRMDVSSATKPLSESLIRSGKGEDIGFHHRLQLCNAKIFQEHQTLDKFRRRFFPEKILTRSHGVDSLRYLKSNGSLKLGNQNYQGSSHDSLDSIQKYKSVDELIGKIYSLAKDQHGCRFLQKKLTEGRLEDVNKIFIEIIGHIVELMIDPFGNYLIQKLLEVCAEDQRMQIIHAVTKEEGMLVGISCNMHGTRAIQKVIETLHTTEQIYVVVSSLRPWIVSLMKDINGNHVAQRCLQYFSPQQSEFLFNAAISHCVEIATDRQGCCVLQKCIHHSNDDYRNKLMAEISSYSLVLSQDPYGNYVLQYVLDQKLPWVISAVLDQLEGNYECLSMQKHSSNVVEKCLKLAKDEDRVKIIQELMSSPRFLQILQNAFGNFVIQSAFKECKGALNVALLEAIKPHVPELRNHPYGKRVLSSTTLQK